MKARRLAPSLMMALAFAGALGGCVRGANVPGGAGPASVEATPTVWVGGVGGYVARSSDGGATWTARPHAADFRSFANDIAFGDPAHGVFTGAISAAARTADGGSTWTTVAMPPPARTLQAVEFVSPSTVWGVGYQKGFRGMTVRSDDAGATWRKEWLGGRLGLRDMDFVDAQHGWVVGTTGIVLRTSDGGASWERFGVGSSVQLDGVSFVDTQTGWAVGRSYGPRAAGGGHSMRGVVYATTDGGSTWHAQSVPADASWNDVAFVDKRTGWVAGWTFPKGRNAREKGRSGPSAVVLRTADGGATWTATPVSKGAYLARVAFFDEKRGWAVGSKWMGPISAGLLPGLVFRTMDGGDTWERITTPGIPELAALALVPSP